MRRLPLAVVLLGLVVPVGLLAVQSVPAAQDATPTGEAAPIALESLGSAPSPDAPGMQLVLLRATIAPGAVAPPHVHPGQLIVAVESGSVAYTILDEEGESGRGRFGTPTAAEVIPPGTEVLLGSGESGSSRSPASCTPSAMPATSRSSSWSPPSLRRMSHSCSQ